MTVVRNYIQWQLFFFFFFFIICLVCFNRVNANIDLIVPALSLLKALNVSHTAPSDHSSLNSVMQLEQLVSFSMLHCAGIERVFSDPELFTHIVQVAETLPHTVSPSVCRCLNSLEN